MARETVPGWVWVIGGIDGKGCVCVDLVGGQWGRHGHVDRVEECSTANGHTRDMADVAGGKGGHSMGTVSDAGQTLRSVVQHIEGL